MGQSQTFEDTAASVGHHLALLLQKVCQNLHLKCLIPCWDQKVNMYLIGLFCRIHLTWGRCEDAHGIGTPSVGIACLVGTAACSAMILFISQLGEDAVSTLHRDNAIELKVKSLLAKVTGERWH